MENQPLKAKNITISGVEVLTWGVKLKDEKGLIYNVSQAKKDGQTTRAYLDLTALPNNGMGLQKCMKYAEAENKQGGTSRYVRMISDPEVGATPTPAQNNFSQTRAKVETRDYNAEAFGKCKHAFLIESFRAFTTLKHVPTEEELIITEKSAEAWAEMSMRKRPQEMPQELQDMEEVPRDEFKTEDIPF